MRLKVSGWVTTAQRTSARGMLFDLHVASA